MPEVSTSAGCATVAVGPETAAAPSHSSSAVGSGGAVVVVFAGSSVVSDASPSPPPEHAAASATAATRPPTSRGTAPPLPDARPRKLLPAGLPGDAWLHREGVADPSVHEARQLVGTGQRLRDSGRGDLGAIGRVGQPHGGLRRPLDDRRLQALGTPVGLVGQRPDQIHV